MADVSTHTQRSHPNWADSLKFPKGAKPSRAASEHAPTLLGHILRELTTRFDKMKEGEPPSATTLSELTFLTKELYQELRRLPFIDREPRELNKMDEIMARRSEPFESNPLLQTARHLIAESFLASRDRIQSLIGKGWRHGDTSEHFIALQNYTVTLSGFADYDQPVAELVAKSIPSRSWFRVSPEATMGAIALLSLAADLGDKDAREVMISAGLRKMVTAEQRTHTLCPLARPEECHLVTFFLAQYLRAMCMVGQKSHPTMWVPRGREAFDLASSWVEGDPLPIHNYLTHADAISRPSINITAERLYHEHGVRNFHRLRLDNCDTPWLLAEQVAEGPAAHQQTRDVLLCAVSSGDWNGAFSEWAWEFERIRQLGDTRGWSLDFVETRDATELGIHLLRHHHEGRRIRALHYFGHGCKDTAEFGHLIRPERSQLELRHIFAGAIERELFGIMRKCVDTLVLHTCSSAKEQKHRKVENVAQAAYTAMDGKVTVIGLDSNDAFNSFNHTRRRDGEVLFTGSPVYGGSRRFLSERHRRRRLRGQRRSSDTTPSETL